MGSQDVGRGGGGGGNDLRGEQAIQGVCELQAGGELRPPAGVSLTFLVHSSSCFAQLWKSFFHEIWPFDDNSPFHDGGPGAGSGGDIRTGVGGSSGGAAERTMA